MARMVLEKTGQILTDEDGTCQAYRDGHEIGKQMLALASADPPWLEEESLTLTDNGDGTYRVHAVMNTEKGRRILVRKVE